MGLLGGEDWVGRGRAYEEKTSPRKALSFAIRGRVFVNSVWALA